MAVELNRPAFDYAKDLLREKRFVNDERGNWSEHQPITREENRFIRAHGFGEYGRWHLGFDNEAEEDSKERYKFLYGDFRNVHRCALLAAEVRAGQYKYLDIERAAHELHVLIRPPVPRRHV
ncbi:MAG: hypothetical protein JWN85_3963 [Gammaproteobacteria bacterium]|nr:hypothetical protein [Gammaproteobacteria bacterium]